MRAALLASVAAAFGAPPAAAQNDSAPSTPPAPPSLDGPATTALATWEPPAEIREDFATSLGVRVQADGKVIFRTRLVRDGAVCPAAPPATGGTRIVLAPPATAPAPGAPYLGSGMSTRAIKTSVAGHAVVCGWIVADAPAGAVLATFAQPYSVVSRRASISGTLPTQIAAGESFDITLRGATPGPGRRALVMADPFTGQNCADMLKAPAGARHLQGVYGLAEGNYTKPLKLRFRNATTPGAYLLCIQIVELTDRVPEAMLSTVVNVGATLKCQNATIAADRRAGELTILRSRRDRSLERLKAAKRKAEPARKRYLNAKRASDKRVDRARRAVSRAKSKAAKQRAQRRLSTIKRTEARRLKVRRAPYTKLERPVLAHRRSWKRWTRGVTQIHRSLKTATADRAKYC